MSAVVALRLARFGASSGSAPQLVGQQASKQFTPRARRSEGRGRGAS
jgi:hypothetical protein